MACEYYSRVTFEQFTDPKILAAALGRLKKEGFNTEVYKVYGLEVMADKEPMNRLKQAYQTEAARAALKKKGFFVSETRDRETGKIKLTVRA
jgi:hypothetical protein